MDYREAQKILEQQKAAKALVDKYKKLESAHKDYGYKSRSEFIAALEEVDGRSATAGATRGAGTRVGPRGRKGKRTRLTPQARAELEAGIKGGKRASELAKQFGISQPYVYALKSSLKTRGVVRSATKAKAGIRTKAPTRRGKGRKAKRATAGKKK